jgi:hypothetical protein
LAAAAPGRRQAILADIQAHRDVVRPLGPAPWENVVFQAAGLAGPRLCVLGCDFRARASPAASAAWYAQARGLPLSKSGDGTDPRVAAAVERLERCEVERARLVVRVLDRIAAAARRRDDPDVGAYFLAEGRVHLFRVSESPRVARLLESLRHLTEELDRRAEEACR